MKKIVCLAVAVFFAVGIMGAFGQEPSASSAKGGEKSLFQAVSDTMSGKCCVKDKNKIKPLEKSTFFQDMSDGIAKGSEEAKSKTLRTK